ncbi:MAG: methylated-DNA--[protein]-cysteine S-methyltransferase [bacterium]
MHASAYSKSNITVYSSFDGIIKISLPYCTHLPDKVSVTEFVSTISAIHKGPHPMGERLALEINDYLQGKIFRFHTYPLLKNRGSIFQKKVWDTLTNIEYGQTRSYQWLAEQIGQPRAQRAVGGALHKNPWPILLPCHRVIGKDGSYRNYSSGLFWKIILLKLEEKCITINQEFSNTLSNGDRL